MLDRLLDLVERHYVPATLIAIALGIVALVAVFASLA